MNELVKKDKIEDGVKDHSEKEGKKNTHNTMELQMTSFYIDSSGKVELSKPILDKWDKATILMTLTIQD